LEEKDTKILEKFSKIWIDKIEKKTYLLYDTLFNETNYLLSELNKDRLILLTMRNNRENLLWELKKLGLIENFEFILTCSPLKNKDKTVPLLKFVRDKKLNLNKNSIIIGDSETDIVTGKNLNMTTLAVCYGIRSKEFLISMNPDYCLKNIDEVVNILKVIYKLWIFYDNINQLS